MSFMFNPYPYDDPRAVNTLELPGEIDESIIAGNRASAQYISDLVHEKLQSGHENIVLAFEGYIGARFVELVELVSTSLQQRKVEVKKVGFDTVYKTEDQIAELLSANLAEDREKDPVLLFGKLYKGRYEDFVDPEKLKQLEGAIHQFKENTSRAVYLISGYGCAIKKLRQYYDLTCYFDVTPKEVVLRARRGEVVNLGDSQSKSVKVLLRRCYYVDFEVAGKLRWELIREGAIDLYIASTDARHVTLLPVVSFTQIMAALVKRPFRCKPVYLEGVWGGHYIKKIRNLPEKMRNCAWVFDLIPLEVSIVVRIRGKTIEFPFFTFVQKEGEQMMGRECMEKFGGYFPIRFNYDDSFHSSGNMSIQVHSGHDYNVENFGEHGRQDESYYVVATGQGAVTYLGFNEEANPDEFIQQARTSEKEHTPVDYRKYINYVKSEPGLQVLIPAGTIHSSGRNQVVLEVGSLTVGSYTFKLYDYLRADLDGKPRPIHTYHGDHVLVRGRTAGWVKENLVRQPQLVSNGDGWAEYIIGEHELLYFSLRRLEFESFIEGDTKGTFHVLNLVDGEQVLVQSQANPGFSYTQHYLDVIVVPANIGKYRVTNLGDQPVCLHKTVLKDGFINNRIPVH
jgi:mannose-6-phosphate isomerase